MGLFFYFKKIHVKHCDNIPKGKPVLILANHQNALLDALVIAAKCDRFSYFLTRASVFNSKVIAWLLQSLRMLPVYRMRDGIQTIVKNKTIFRTCSQLLKDNQTIVIFPEGNHNLKRTVRPLSKGFTRLVFDTLDENPDLDLQLVPVGFNYVLAQKFVDEVSVHIGKPISANDFVDFDKNEAVLRLKETVHQSISKLTAHIPSDAYDETLKKLEDLQVDFLDPESVNRCINNDFQDCKVLKGKKSSLIKKICKGVVIINLWLPYLVWKLLVLPKIDEIEFISTFRFTVAVTLVPFFLLVVTFMASFFIGWSFAFLYLLAVLLLALIVVKN